MVKKPKEINEIESKEFENRLVEMRSQHLMVLDKQLDVLNDMPSGMGYQQNFRARLNVIKMILEIMDKKEKLLENIKNVPKIIKKKSKA